MLAGKVDTPFPLFTPVIPSCYSTVADTGKPIWAPRRRCVGRLFWAVQRVCRRVLRRRGANPGIVDPGVDARGHHRVCGHIWRIVGRLRRPGRAVRRQLLALPADRLPCRAHLPVLVCRRPDHQPHRRRYPGLEPWLVARRQSVRRGAHAGWDIAGTRCETSSHRTEAYC
jgi:hypothetical protein